MTYTQQEQDLLKQNKKDPKPIINLPTGATTISDEVEDWLILQPNEAKKMLVWLIDETLSNHSQTSEIEQRLLKELSDTSSKLLKQRLWVLDEQTKGISSLTGYYQAGLSATGVIEAPIPAEALRLLNLIRYPIQNILSQRDGYDYEVRLNTFLVASRAKSDFLSVDSRTLSAWRDLIAEYTEGLDAPPPALATLANSLAVVSTTPTYMRGALTGERKQNREIIIQVANAQAYPPNRLLAQIYQESRYVATAQNRVTGAAGLGQFLKNTGPSYDLRNYPQDYFDPKKACYATIRYMRNLQKQNKKWGARDETESWKIALAAYNWGPGNVEKAFRRASINLSGSSKIKWSDIEGIAPTETRNYVRLITQMEGNPP